MNRLLTKEEIDLICEARRQVDLPGDLVTHICKAQAALTRAETLSECCEHIKQRMKPLLGCIILSTDLEIVCQDVFGGKAPWEVT